MTNKARKEINLSKQFQTLFSVATITCIRNFEGKFGYSNRIWSFGSRVTWDGRDGNYHASMTMR